MLHHQVWFVTPNSNIKNECNDVSFENSLSKVRLRYLRQAEPTAQQRSSSTSSNQKAREPPRSGSSRKASSSLFLLVSLRRTEWQVFVTELSLLLLCRGASAKTSVPIILDGKRLSEDDDESKQFVVEEMVPLPPGVPQLDMVTVMSFKY